MGLNISGFIIDKDFSKSIEDIESCFNWKLIDPTETTFDSARDSKSNSNCIDFYFTSNGTLVFLWEAYYSHFAFCDLSSLGTVIHFNLSETNMSFSFALYKDDECIGRHFFKKDKDDNWEDKENKPFLRVSRNDDLIFGTFSNILKEVMGKSMQEIGLREKVKRFTMLNT
jgi:hypothetical protein